MFTYVVNTVVAANQLVVRLVLDGVNESDGTSDPFHHNQVHVCLGPVKETYFA